MCDSKNTIIGFRIITFQTERHDTFMKTKAIAEHATNKMEVIIQYDILTYNCPMNFNLVLTFGSI